MPDFQSGLTYGSMSELYLEYIKRSEPFTMKNDHFHSHYEVYYLMSGSRIYFIKDRSYSVEQGDLVFIDKEVLHRTMQSGDASHERVVIHFTDEWLRSLGPEHAELLATPFAKEIHVLRLSRQESLAIDAAVRGMLNEAQHREPGFALAVPHAVSGMLLSSARYIARHQPEPFRHASPLHAKISEIVRYINGHYNEPLRLSDLSERFFISPHYLSRMFKEVTGFPFTDYVVLTRVKEAQRLLRETELTVSVIAERVGFDNFSHFGKTFKKVSSVSPREYRKSMSRF
ncbi:AraC family transcriptional regulator [Paenibacillus sp. LHD-117]|uniref:AraC family transcriptional regulator n=1 Tax=Paenibacillus sp. LHD-117 TaxID=3071412 RepID=UPI0027DF8629|nr:AraC family transcriptional regulator [Paenibacillus sp. LHD-117]MDQ6422275.1 AraC family transcriptional regulator [Paenibacillus sp. LHD-117]